MIKEILEEEQPTPDELSKDKLTAELWEQQLANFNSAIQHRDLLQSKIDKLKEETDKLKAELRGDVVPTEEEGEETITLEEPDHVTDEAVQEIGEDLYQASNLNETMHFEDEL